MYSSIVFVFAREVSLDGTFLDVFPSSDWGILTPSENERICSKYSDCIIPFYKCIFSILGIWMPLNGLEMDVLNHLIVALSQLHPLNWAYIKVFNYWCKYLNEKPSLTIFFHLFKFNIVLCLRHDVVV